MSLIEQILYRRAFLLRKFQQTTHRHAGWYSPVDTKSLYRGGATGAILRLIADAHLLPAEVPIVGTKSLNTCGVNSMGEWTNQ